MMSLNKEVMSSNLIPVRMACQLAKTKLVSDTTESNEEAVGAVCSLRRLFFIFAFRKI